MRIWVAAGNPAQCLAHCARWRAVGTGHAEGGAYETGRGGRSGASRNDPQRSTSALSFRSEAFASRSDSPPTSTRDAMDPSGPMGALSSLT